ncbi:MAG: copper chaperone PCu(A)C, partial [Melioribacteraceae bacterium]
MKKIIIAAAILLFPVIISSQPITNRQSLITIKDAWIRPSVKDANSALFFEVTNNAAAADTLLSAKSELAEMVEVHETYKKENDMMGMREVEKVPVPAKSSVMFKPRGLHIM